MPSFGDRSLKNLDSCHLDLQDLMNEAIKHVDFSVIEGHRTTKRQQELYADGRSTLDGVHKKSKHQEFPSRAVDVLPYPADLHDKNIWQDPHRFLLFLGTVKGLAISMNIDIRLGADWDGDGSTANHRFVDMPHLELV